VVLPDCDLARAVILAERLRRLVAQTPVATTAGDVAVTISAGVAAGVPLDADQLAGLMRAADQALYDAKHRGRDRVVAL
jgi:diguanylate cyclase (GGDEF)-like protein